MYKFIKILALSTLIWIGNSVAFESPLVDLNRGTMIIPCILIQLDGEDLVAADLRMNQRGSALNWEVVAVEPADECDASGGLPVAVEEKLPGKPEKDGACIAKNLNANNCGTKFDEEETQSKSDDDEDDEDEDDEDDEDEDD
ncbi:MAG: hypothetical protein KZQ83_06350 [gamma proteobacterium symbiont of Taylorina sp.]|nr:hypothetical protein [gamma proteobacterium symbiont of Taylorina sp.]